MEEIRPELTAEALAGEGIQEVQQEELVVGDDTQAVLIQAQQDAGGVSFERLLLVTGDAEKTVQVQASWPADQGQALRQPIREALLSVQLEEAAAESQIDYDIDLADGYEQAVADIGGVGDAYGRQGQQGVPFLLVAQSLGSGLTDRSAAFAEQLLLSTPLGDIDMGATTDVMIGDLEGLQTQATGTNTDGGAVRVQHVVLFTAEGEYWRLVGVSADDDTAAVTELDNMIQSFRLR